MNTLQCKVLFEFRMLLFCSQRKTCHTLEGVHWLRVPSSRRKAPQHCFFRNCKVNLSSCGRYQKTGRALQIPNNFTDGCHFLQFQMIDSEFHSTHAELASTMPHVAPLLAMLFPALISCQTSNTTLEAAAVVSFSSCAGCRSARIPPPACDTCRWNARSSLQKVERPRGCKKSTTSQSLHKRMLVNAATESSRPLMPY
jgi:hypothetical protein